MATSLKELKKNRLTPAEKWLVDFIEGVKPKTYPDGSVDWGKDDEWVFTQNFKHGYLDVSYFSIWLVLEKEFGLNDDEIFELSTNILYDYTDNGKLKIKNNIW